MIGDKFKLTISKKEMKLFMMREKIKIKDPENKTRNENNVFRIIEK